MKARPNDVDTKIFAFIDVRKMLHLTMPNEHTCDFLFSRHDE